MNKHDDNSEWLSRLLYKTHNYFIRRPSLWRIVSTTPSVRFYGTFLWVLLLIIVGLEALAQLGIISLTLLPSDVVMQGYQVVRSLR